MSFQAYLDNIRVKTGEMRNAFVKWRCSGLPLRMAGARLAAGIGPQDAPLTIVAPQRRNA